MTDIAISKLGKAFGGNRVVSDVTMHIRSGEFVAVLGPSGCGKTTLLRLIAGFERPDAGSVRFAGELASSATHHTPPEKRDLGIVFQNYALWPHMSVAENVGYSLKVTGVPANERERRVAEALKTVALDAMAERRPSDLSGGQRQRVALSRCLAARNGIVLLDEPLANLDVHLRAAMEHEFTRFHQASGSTMVYITHDQSEAMALADRVAVMDAGRLVQFAAPSTLYREPATEMVAGFIGEGIVLPAEDIVADGDGRAHASILGSPVQLRCAPGERARRRAAIGLHPQDIRLATANERGLSARIRRLSYRGGSFRAEAVSEAAPETVLAFDLPEQAPLAPGAAVSLAIGDGWVIPALAA
ncbi:MAG: ABC transporter ATP-binding protein [Candidatus Kaistia colombiensis]|nr:MAG: ABC transporter ATP-binding protein [Kaistia sp.]